MTDQPRPDPGSAQPGAGEPSAEKAAAPVPDPGSAPDAATPPGPLVAWDPPPAAPPPAPLVAWDPAPAAPPAAASEAGSYVGGPPPFSIGALLSDTFARYGADVLRLLAVSALASALSWLGSLVAPMGSRSFAPPTGFVDVGGILGLASFVVGLVASSTTFALAEGGPAVAFGRALRRGVERAGWLFLTSLLLGVAFVALFLLALIPIGLFAFITPALIIVPLIVLFLFFIWAAMRLSLALPANVADNLNSIEAVKLSWRATRPTGVWLRLLGASFLLGLLVAPAAFGAILLFVPAIFTAGGNLAVLLVPAVAFAVLTPLTALLSFSAYRRLVPPLQPSWTAPSGMPAVVAGVDIPPPAAPVVDAPAVTVPAAPETGVEPAGPVFRVPRLGATGKALIALMLALDVVGIAAVPYGIGQLERLAREGFPGFPGSPGFPPFPGGDSSVVPGQVAFGTGVDLENCTIDRPLFFATAGTQVEWIAALEQRVTPQDEVFVRITSNGRELETSLQAPGTYDCLGTDVPGPGLAAGVYTYEVLVNGSVGSTGSLFVQ